MSSKLFVSALSAPVLQRTVERQRQPKDTSVIQQCEVAPVGGEEWRGGRSCEVLIRLREPRLLLAQVLPEIVSQGLDLFLVDHRAGPSSSSR